MEDRGAIVITGASTGIGRDCALRLDGLGFRVFAGVRRPDAGNELEARTSGRLRAIRLDVTDQDSLAAALETVGLAIAGRGLAGLVNNAGLGMAGPVELTPIDELRRLLEVNVVGAVAATQTFLPLLRAGQGRIVNVGSVSGRSVLPFLGLYAASKHALEAVTDALRVELAPWGIAVSIVEPGRVATPFIEKTRDVARSMVGTASPEARALYERTFTAMASLEVARPAMPPAAVVDDIIHALTAPRPKTRYLVGRDARLRRLFALIPDRMRDRIILRRLGT
jgi:NAD(P)-dependent dehydrogenase (short-subunit alcohol dehydrogenase family)